MEGLILNKLNYKKLGILFLIIVFSFTIVACDTAKNNMGSEDGTLETIKNAEEISSITVDYGTSANIVIEYYLPEKITLTLDNNEKVTGEIAWYTPANYDSKKPDTYKFEGKATYKNINYNDIIANVEVASKKDETLIDEVTVSNVPQSLTGKENTNTQSINTKNMITSLDQSSWGHFEMIPQTGSNYNT